MFEIDVYFLVLGNLFVRNLVIVIDVISESAACCTDDVVVPQFRITLGPLR